MILPVITVYAIYVSISNMLIGRRGVGIDALFQMFSVILRLGGIGGAFALTAFCMILISREMVVKRGKSVEALTVALDTKGRKGSQGIRPSKPGDSDR